MGGAARALTASALWGALENNLTMTGFDFNDDLAELTLDKLLPYTPLFPSRRADRDRPDMRETPARLTVKRWPDIREIRMRCPNSLASGCQG